MKCRRAKINMQRYIGGRLGRKDTKALHDHILSCPSCYLAWKQAVSLEGLLTESFAPAEPPAGLLEAVTARLPRRTAKNASSRGSLRRRFGLATVAAVLMLCVGLTGIWQGPLAPSIPVPPNSSEPCGVCGEEPCVCNPPAACEVCGKEACICQPPVILCGVCGKEPCVCKPPVILCGVCGKEPCVCKPPVILCGVCGKEPCVCKPPVTGDGGKITFPVPMAIAQDHQLYVSQTITLPAADAFAPLYLGDGRIAFLAKTDGEYQWWAYDINNDEGAVLLEDFSVAAATVQALSDKNWLFAGDAPLKALSPDGSYIAGNKLWYESGGKVYAITISKIVKGADLSANPYADFGDIVGAFAVNGYGKVLSWAPDNKKVARTDANGKLFVTFINTETRTCTDISIVDGIVRNVCWSEDGKALFYDCEDRESGERMIRVVFLS